VSCIRKLSLVIEFEVVHVHPRNQRDARLGWPSNPWPPRLEFVVPGRRSTRSLAKYSGSLLLLRYGNLGWLFIAPLTFCAVRLPRTAKPPIPNALRPKFALVEVQPPCPYRGAACAAGRNRNTREHLGLPNRRPRWLSIPLSSVKSHFRAHARSIRRQKGQTSESSKLSWARSFMASPFFARRNGQFSRLEFVVSPVWRLVKVSCAWFCPGIEDHLLIKDIFLLVVSHRHGKSCGS